MLFPNPQSLIPNHRFSILNAQFSIFSVSSLVIFPFQWIKNKLNNPNDKFIIKEKEIIFLEDIFFSFVFVSFSLLQEQLKLLQLQTFDVRKQRQLNIAL